ncbi:phage tail protein [Pseudomonas sp. S11A4]|uniref:phage tail protein n=1 Tax=Pseudomonas sp. S11A4 TaxID=1476791 RepID=UPI00406CA1FA
MNKPRQPESHLLAHGGRTQAQPGPTIDLHRQRQDPLHCRATLSFECNFDLQVILTDFAGHPDSVMLPLLGWLSVHQSELLENLSKAADGAFSSRLTFSTTAKWI